jgi:protoheme IX farnesyltransferase
VSREARSVSLEPPLESVADAADAAAAASAAAPSAASLATYLSLAKPRLVFLVLVTTVLGFVLASRGAPLDVPRLLVTLAGTMLVAGGASALNMVLEREADALMERTRRRALPMGLIEPERALAVGVVAAAAGVLWLAASVNVLTAFLGAASIALYVFLYTPLKKVSPACTLVGAIPGAIPPVMGWTAVRGSLSLEAGILFAILFHWQLPHFYAIAWLYRKDYERGGFPMLPVVDPSGSSTSRLSVLGAVALLATTLAPSPLGMRGPLYYAGALLLGGAFVAVTVLFAARRRDADARRLFLASILYLPLLLGLFAFSGNAS